MSNEHITEEKVAELWRTFAGTNEVLRIERRNFKHVLGAILKGAALRPAAQPAEQWETSPKGAEQWQTVPMGGEQWQTVPFAQPAQTWDANQIAMACAQAEISDGHCQSLLIALEESNKD